MDKKVFYKSKFEFDKSFFENQEFIIPEIPKSMGVEYHRNPLENDENILKKRMDWINSCGYFKSEKELEVVLKKEHYKIASFLYPDVGKTTFEFIVIMYEHGFLMDDYFYEKGSFMKEVDNYLDGEYEKQESFGKLYRDIYNEYKGYGNPINFERILLENKNWTKGASIASSFGKYYAGMPIKECVELRRFDAGGCYAATFMTACTDDYVSNEIYNSDIFNELRYHYECFGAVCNDLYSFKKEIHDNSFSNIVKIISVENGDFQKGIDQTLIILCDHLSKFFQLLDKVSLLHKDNKSLQVYLKRYKLLAYGTYYLHFYSGRYST